MASFVPGANAKKPRTRDTYIYVTVYGYKAHMLLEICESSICPINNTRMIRHIAQ